MSKEGEREEGQEAGKKGREVWKDDWKVLLRDLLTNKKMLLWAEGAGIIAACASLKWQRRGDRTVCWD